MSFGSTLFGSTGQDIPPTSKLRNLDITPDAFKALRGQIASLLGGATTGKSTLDVSGIPSYTGDYTAPATDQEMSLINMLFGRTGEDVKQAQLDPTLSQFTAGNTPLQQAGTSEILKTLAGTYLDPKSNPFLAGTIKAATDPITQNWLQNVMPNLKLGFAKAGQTITGLGSSPFDRAAALASNDYLTQVSDASAKLAGQNYQNERANMLQALGLGQQQTQQEIGAQTANLSNRNQEQQYNLQERQAKTQELLQTLQAVALPRLIKQYGLDQGTAEFRSRVQSLMQLLGMEGSLATGTYANAQPSASTQGIFGQVLGGTGSLATGTADLYSVM